MRLVGNLPYNISTPILFHLLKNRTLIKDMHFMLQREVVDRSVRAPGNKTYGRLSIMVQYHCRVMPLIPVPPSAFRPHPRSSRRLCGSSPTAPNPAWLKMKSYLVKLSVWLSSSDVKPCATGMRAYAEHLMVVERDCDLSTPC